MPKKVKESQLLTVKPEPNAYEMVVVFKPFLPDKVRNDADDKVSSIITESGGKVNAKDIWGKRYLAYKVQGHVEGYYVMYQFETIPAGVEQVKKHLNRHQEILRYLIIKREANDTAAPKVKSKKSTVNKKNEDSKE